MIKLIPQEKPSLLSRLNIFRRKNKAVNVEQVREPEFYNRDWKIVKSKMSAAEIADANCRILDKQVRRIWEGTSCRV